MSAASQDENEKPAKVWQVNEVSAKIDSLKELIKGQSQTYYTKDEVSLLLAKQGSRVDDLKKTVGNIIRVVWIVVGTVVPIAVATVWQLVVNQGRVG